MSIQATHLETETISYEEKEQQLVNDCVKELREYWTRKDLLFRIGFLIHKSFIHYSITVVIHLLSVKTYRPQMFANILDGEVGFGL